MYTAGTLPITIACGFYDRTRALLQGEVPIEGTHPTFVAPARPSEIFWRMIRYQEFDVSEMSLSSYLRMVDREDRRFVALPVFPSRAFRHSNVYVHRDVPWRKPADLRDKRIGIGEYEQTVGLYVRGILENDYGIAPDAFHWVLGREPKLQYPLPPQLSVSVASPGESLSDMLEHGNLDAIIAPRQPEGPCRSLFRDPQAAERDWYRRTGIFPIMHCVVMRRSLYESHPWLATSLFKAFSQAKAAAFQEFSDYLRWTLPWHRQAVLDTEALMGKDWWPYGIAANRTSLDAAMQYAFEQGLTTHPLTPERAFLDLQWTNE